MKVVLYSVLSFIVLTNAAPQNRIVNGTESNIKDFPFIVSLRSVTGAHSCGGSIVAPNWILTAAHCVLGRVPANMSVQYGLTEINEKGPNTAQVKRYIMHENYITASLGDDIALVELKGRLIYNYKTIGPVTLPKQNFEIAQTAEGDVGILLGWGRNYTEGPIQTILREAYLKVYSDDECSQRWNGSVSKDVICGGVDEGWKGPCTGDSGSPLILADSHVQVGIMSHSRKPCQIPPTPGVLTKVSHYVTWIKNQISTS